MEGVYNLRSRAVKRLMREAEELREATEEYYAQPLDDNLFEWHFTVRGPPKSDFEGGLYHGRIVLPPDYPMKPPSIIMLTPSGRFEVNKKICLSISGHHPESWQPSWSIRTALVAMIGFMPTHGNGAIGSLDYTPEERRKLALKSRKWKCPGCGPVVNILRTACRDDKFEMDDKRNDENVTNTSSEFHHNAEDDEAPGEQDSENIEPEPLSSVSYQDSGTCMKDDLVLRTSVPRIDNDSGLEGGGSEMGEPSSHVSSASYWAQSNKCSLIAMWTIVLLILALLFRRLMSV